MHISTLPVLALAGTALSAPAHTFAARQAPVECDTRPAISNEVFNDRSSQACERLPTEPTAAWEDTLAVWYGFSDSGSAKTDMYSLFSWSVVGAPENVTSRKNCHSAFYGAFIGPEAMDANVANGNICLGQDGRAVRGWAFELDGVSYSMKWVRNQNKETSEGPAADVDIKEYVVEKTDWVANLYPEYADEVAHGDAPADALAPASTEAPAPASTEAPVPASTEAPAPASTDGLAPGQVTDPWGPPIQCDDKPSIETQHFYEVAKEFCTTRLNYGSLDDDFIHWYGTSSESGGDKYHQFKFSVGDGFTPEKCVTAFIGFESMDVNVANGNICLGDDGRQTRAWTYELEGVKYEMKFVQLVGGRPEEKALPADAEQSRKMSWWLRWGKRPARIEEQQ